MVERGSINVNSDAAKVLHVAGETLAFVAEGEEIASQETCLRLTSILIEMQQQLSAEKMNAAFSCISVDAQNGINLAMQG